MAHFDSVEKDTRKAKEGSRSGQTRRFSRKAPKGCLTRPDTRKKRASSIKLMTKQATLDALFLFSIKKLSIIGLICISIGSRENCQK